MKMRRLLHASLLISVLMTAIACGSDSPDAKPDGGPGTPDGGPPPPPPPLPTDPNDPKNDTKDTDCDGLSDKVEFETLREGGKTNPGIKDTDNDGLPDGLELGVTQPVAGTSCPDLLLDSDPRRQTNPLAYDTDGDGLWDGVEDANKNGKVDDGETNPLLKDTDCDGLIDGPTQGNVKGEDQNANGVREPNETDPRSFDTDGDGISDGVESGVTVSPDPGTCSGIFIPDSNPGTVTNPTNPDSDGDGIPDGAEDTNQNGGVDPGELDPNAGDANGPVGQVCTINNLRPVTFQAEDGADLKLALPPTFTEVTQIKSGNEVKGLVGYDNTTKVAFLAFRRAAPAGSTDPLGDEEALRGAINGTGSLTNRTAQVFKTWDSFNAVQAFYDQAGAGTDLKRRTDALVNALVPGSTGRLSAEAAGVGGDFRLQALFVHRSNDSVVVLVAVVPLANVTGTNRSSDAAFYAKDLSDGSALAQFGEPTAVQCEQFKLAAAKVDFLFVVDDSGSMASSQNALAATASAAADSLNASGLDWRMAMVTSSYHFGTSWSNAGTLRRFTRNVNKVQAWLTTNSNCVNNVCSLVPTTPTAPECPGALRPPSEDSNGKSIEGASGGCWVGLAGNGAEGVLGAARKAIDDMTPGTAPTEPESTTLARRDATLVVVLLGDADDQTARGVNNGIENCGTGGNKEREGSGCEPVQTYINFFGNVVSPVTPTNKTGKLITVHGIICPGGSYCGCGTGQVCDSSNNGREFNPQTGGVSKARNASVVNATGGVIGSIIDNNSIRTSMDAIIADAIGNAGYKTLKPPIGASLKVALSAVKDANTCNANNVPRSTVNGFDFDGSARTLSLFGACRPANESSQAAVSYQYWIDQEKDPNGGVPCQDDPDYDETDPDHCDELLRCNEATDTCVCPANCNDTCGAGTRCDEALCACVPTIG
ncbi:adventurous gliding motility lipoprotein CglD [Stigmatella aurantiaca]|uniref:Thrombospondin type 3 repeat family n=1 Tax=Stigmatella aurantiaca (strain DW4/3-1) TaxID=378806 RepID=Q09E52_STIAD|nr:adventurous gliding motility lipoprotein CglD [Stigmatella aurantiaca]ADO74739.1 Thrombospondin type 3 repeat family [Stigmatella aurantiaca DW4/3-1]EAU70088.1 thrombospondin type 3 repeat family [Stigmatella aurantiaca DW4/3-1]